MAARREPRNPLPACFGSALGVGTTSLVIGIWHDEPNKIWVGAAFLLIAVLLAGLMLRDRVAHRRITQHEEMPSRPLPRPRGIPSP